VRGSERGEELTQNHTGIQENTRKNAPTNTKERQEGKR
jgi:hypothetical protein